MTGSVGSGLAHNFQLTVAVAGAAASLIAVRLFATRLLRHRLVVCKAIAACLGALVLTAYVHTYVTAASGAP